MGAATFDKATITQLDAFKTKCLDQDITSVVEFAKELMDRGCTITFAGHRRQLQDILDEIKATQSGAPLMQLQVVVSEEDCPFDSVYGETSSIQSPC